MPLNVKLPLWVSQLKLSSHHWSAVLLTAVLCCRTCWWSKAMVTVLSYSWSTVFTYQTNLWTHQSTEDDLFLVFFLIGFFFAASPNPNTSAYLNCLCWTHGGNSSLLSSILWTKLSLNFCQTCKKTKKKIKKKTVDDDELIYTCHYLTENSKIRAL